MGQLSSPAEDGNPNLRRNATAVGAGILLSRIAGLVREVVTARLLGTGVGAEAFRAALRVPNLLQNLLGEGVLSASFVPVHARMLAEGRLRDAGRLAGAVAGLLTGVVVLVVTLTVVFAEQITRVLAYGFVPGTERFELTVTLVRIVTPGVGLLVLSAWCLAILNANRRFFLSYVAPALWNVAIVVALVTAATRTLLEAELATAMAFGALAGSALQFGVQLPLVLRLTKGLRLSMRSSAAGVAEVRRRFLDVLTGRGGVQIAAYVDLLAASLLAFGAVAALGYAQVLYLLPISLFAMSVAAAELPELSTIDHGDRARVVGRLDDALGRVAFFVLPTATAYLVAGDLVIAAVFGGGRFTPDAVVQVGAILAAYGLALPASAASRPLQSVLYGVGDTRTAARFALARVAVAGIVGIAAMLPLDAVAASTDGLRLVDTPGFAVATSELRIGPDNLLRLGAVGLAFGAAVGSWVELMLLRRRTSQLFGAPRLIGHHRRAIVIGCLALASVGVVARMTVDDGLATPRIHALVAMALMGGVYLMVTHLLGADELRLSPRGGDRPG